MIRTPDEGAEVRGRHADSFLPSVIHALAGCRGPDHALTLEQLTAAAGLPARRMTEICLERNLSRLPWPIVADGHGVYIPTDADQLNRYLESLRSRAVCCFTRARAVRTKAAAHGWQRDGKRFARPPQQLNLFDPPSCRAAARGAPEAVGSPLAGDAGNKQQEEQQQ